MSKRKSRTIWLGARAVLAALLVVGVQDAWGQYRPAPAAPGAPGAPQANVRIRKLPKLGRGLLVDSPQYQANVPRALSGARQEREWAVMDVIYDTAEDWIDELVFSFVAMSEGRNAANKKEYSLYRGSATYIDIKRGEHVSTMVIPPAAIERYGDIVAFSVEISIGGKVVAEDNIIGITGLPKDWWRNATIIDSPAVVKRDGYMLERAKTPFALANIDDYEAVK